MKHLFENCIDAIQKFYAAHPNLKYGWRFLYGPRNTLTNHNGLSIFGLNPAGNKYSVTESVGKGNAYRIETWSSARKLQQQIILLFVNISNNLKEKLDWKELLDQTLTSNFIPFRSPNIKKLPDKINCIDFSENLWKRTFHNSSLKVIICIGNGKLSAYHFIKSIMKNDSFCLSEKRTHIWGTFFLKVSRLGKQDKDIFIIGLPHLSRCPFLMEPAWLNYLVKIIIQGYDP